MKKILKTNIRIMIMYKAIVVIALICDVFEIGFFCGNVFE